MEHRYCTARRQCNIKTLIYKDNNPISFGRIKNSCPGGIFIEADFKDIQLMQQLKLEITFKENGRKDVNRININVLVIHKTKNGFGAEIDIPTLWQAELFSEILKGGPTQLKDIEIISLAKIC